MINPIFLQVFYSDNPVGDQINRKAAELDERAQYHLDLAAKSKQNHLAAAVVRHSQIATDMQDTAAELRRCTSKYTLDIINTETSRTMLHCDGNDFAHFVSLCESHTKPFGTKTATVEANIISNGKLVYSIISK